MQPSQAFFFSVAFFIASVPSFSGAQSEKPSAAVSPLRSIGKLSDGEKRLFYNSFEGNLSRNYQLIPAETYKAAEETAFQSLNLAQCTEEECIRKIQELLQVERLFFLQVVRLKNFTQLTITLAREGDRVVRTESCRDCDPAAVEATVVKLVAEIVKADLGVELAAPQPEGPIGTGQILISSDPPGAEIRLDGEVITGQTNKFLENIPAGQHKLELTKGNQFAERTFSLASDELARISLKLRTRPARILVVSDPLNATVFLDGKKIGKTPVNTETTAGPHEIEVRASGSKSFLSSVELIAGELYRLEAKLVKPARIRFENLDESHRVLINGKPFEVKSLGEGLGVTSNFKGNPGDYKIEITQEGHKPLDVTRTLAEGETLVVDAQLVPTQELLQEQEYAAWRWAWSSLVVGGGILLVVAFNENEAVTDANSKKAEEESLMLAAPTSNLQTLHRNNARAEISAAKKHETNAQILGIAGLILSGLGVWIYLDPPQKETGVSFMPKLDGDGVWVTLSRKW